MPNPLLLVIGVVVGAALGALIAYLWLGNVRRQRDLVSNAEREKLLSDAETQMKEMVLEAKEEAHRIRMSLEQEVRDARAEIQRSERRVQQKEESIDRKLEDRDREEQAVTAKELEIGRTRERVNDALAEQVKELERISGMTRVEARTTILTNLEKELSQEMAQKIRQGEEIVKEESEKRARNILVTAMQRVAAEQTAETSVSVVAIPSDEMKGRIIGREGRNIRALEHATGVDLIIDDTPEAVILSGFDPVRREVARVALNHLLVDGRSRDRGRRGARPGGGPAARHREGDRPRGRGLPCHHRRRAAQTAREARDPGERGGRSSHGRRAEQPGSDPDGGLRRRVGGPAGSAPRDPDHLHQAARKAGEHRELVRRRGEIVRHPGGSRDPHHRQTRHDRRQPGPDPRPRYRKAHRRRAQLPRSDQGDSDPRDPDRRIRQVR